MLTLLEAARHTYRLEGGGEYLHIDSHRASRRMSCIGSAKQRGMLHICTYMLNRILSERQMMPIVQ